MWASDQLHQKPWRMLVKVYTQKDAPKNSNLGLSVEFRNLNFEQITQ